MDDNLEAYMEWLDESMDNLDETFNKFYNPPAPASRSDEWELAGDDSLRRFCD